MKPGNTAFKPEGLRDLLLYRDLDTADPRHIKITAHLVKANRAAEKGTGWHHHEADLQVVIMNNG